MELTATSSRSERSWLGTTPVYLVIALEAGGVEIDLDERGWMTTYADYLRVKSAWALVDKATNVPRLIMMVAEGEQPYYVARHVGVTGGGGSNEITAYGIGKKRRDGHTDRLWLMPNGLVCGGDDVEPLGIRMLHALGPR